MTEEPTIDERVKQNFSELLDLQSKIVIYSRDMAQRATQLAEAFDLQAERAREIAVLHEEGTLVAAQIFGDIIIAEQGLGLDSDDSDDNDEEDDSTDD